MKAISIVAGACSLAAISAVAALPQSRRDPHWVVPPRAESRQNPLATRPEMVTGGAKVFHQRCSVCHGNDGTGTNRGPNLKTRRVQDQTDGALFWKISSGNTHTGMPSFSFLPEAQRWQLVSHLRAKTK